jgi:hypothetical protein
VPACDELPALPAKLVLPPLEAPACAVEPDVPA